MPKIDLNQQNLNEVCQILQIHVPNYSVWAFGSRVNGKAKIYSDLDLAIITQQPLSLSKMAQLKEAFDESNLPIRVDVVDWGATSEEFQKIILQNKVLIKEGFDTLQVANKLKSQSGAVLAFSLVMLLLLTLAATRMIQQNKQQLEMSNSARLLTQEFANAEGILAEAKNMIDGHASHIDNLPINDKLHQCKPTALSKQNTLLAGTALFQGSAILKKVINGSPRAIILGVRCQSESGTEQVCSSYNSDDGTVTCKANPDCKTIDDAVAAFTESTDICYQNYVGNLDPNDICDVYPGTPDWCNKANTICPKEIYTIQVISTDANGTTRQIVSDHVVGCG